MKLNRDLQERLEEELLVSITENNCGHNCEEYLTTTIDRFNNTVGFYVKQARKFKHSAGYSMNKAIAWYNVNQIVIKLKDIEDLKRNNLTHLIGTKLQENYLK